MGIPKADLPFGDEAMLARVVRLLGTVVQPIVVVAAAGEQPPELSADVIVAHDRTTDRGPLEGLRAELTALAPHAEAAYATSCDVPLLQPAFVRAMIQLLEAGDSAHEEGDSFEIAVPREGKFFHPLAAVYRTSVLPSIDSLLSRDRRRPAFLFDEARTRRVPTEELRHVDPELRTLANLNRPADYVEALHAAGFELSPEIAAALQKTGGYWSL